MVGISADGAREGGGKAPAGDADAAVAQFDEMRRRSRGEAPWSYAERMRLLAQLEKMQVENKEAIIDAIEADFGGRGRPWCMLADVWTGLNTLTEVKAGLKEWMKDEKVAAQVPFNLTGSAYLKYEPLGVVLCITPWNFPVHLATSALADLLGAGNRVIVKPSEHTPRAAALLADLVARYFDPSEVTVALGDHVVAQRLTSLPFDHIMFTGGGGVGRHVMRAAADNLVPCTLELGGKCPVFVDAGYDIKLAAREVVSFKCGNSGQQCNGADYVIVPPGKAGAFADAAAAGIRERWGAKSLKDHPQYCSVLGARNHSRMQGLVDDARAKGATVRTLDPEGADTYPAQTGKFPLTLILPPFDPSNLAAMADEIFGPVLVVMEMDGVDSVVRFVNSRDRPLAFYALTHSQRTKDEVLERIVAGGISINQLGTHTLIQALPFGGIGPSGCGAYHGKYGFQNFSHRKPIYVHHRDIIPNMTLPFSDKDVKTITSLLKPLPPFRKICAGLAAAAVAATVVRRGGRGAGPAALLAAVLYFFKIDISLRR